MNRSALTISLYVPDVDAAITFYERHFGFRRTGQWVENGRPIWAEVSRNGPKGTARIWFFSHAIEERPGPAFSGLVYLFVDDVDAEVERIGDGAAIRWGPEDQPYGLRELGVEDLNGYLLCFAHDI